MKKSQMIRLMFLMGISLVCIAHFVYGAEEYTIGVEDAINISVLEQPDLNGVVTVGPEGTITLPQPIGTINAQGLTRAELEDAIRQKLSKYILGGVHVTVQITQYNSRKITIIGEVRSPGVHSYAKIPSLLEILAGVGGLTPNADQTHIMILSADSQKPTRIVNLQQLLQDSHPAWPQLAPGDTLFVQPKPSAEPTGQKSTSSTQTSEVNKPASASPQEGSPTSKTKNQILIHVLGQVSGSFAYETPPSLPNVLAQAKVPPQPDLLKQIKVIRGDGTSLTIDMEKYIATGDASLLPQLQDGDLIYIPGEDPSQQKHVTLLGAVGSPGKYPINQPTSLQDILAAAGGLTTDADAKKIQITRESQDFIETTTVDLQENTLTIQPGDKIWIPRKTPTSSLVGTTFSLLRDAVFIYGTFRALTR